MTTLFEMQQKSPVHTEMNEGGKIMHAADLEPEVVYSTKPVFGPQLESNLVIE